MLNGADTARSASIERALPDSHDEDPIIVKLNELLRPLPEGTSTTTESFRRYLVLALHEHVANTYGKQSSRPGALTGVLAPWQLRRAKEYMLAHISDDIGLEQTAAECGLSVNHFVRAFRQSVGTTPHRWLILQRLEAAMRLMRDPRKALADIAVCSGFADQSHLTRVFTERLGITPGQWRRASCTGRIPEQSATVADD